MFVGSHELLPPYGGRAPEPAHTRNFHGPVSFGPVCDLVPPAVAM